jgi:hypothetical protein
MIRAVSSEATTRIEATAQITGWVWMGGKLMTLASFGVHSKRLACVT